MQNDSRWYQDPDALLEELRQTDTHWGRVPDFPGYDRVVQIRRGGQGIVYRARQRSTDREVAIKMMIDGSFAAPEDRDRFRREIEAVARLHHRHIVPIYDSGTTEDGRSFYVMEYVHGLPIDHPDLPQTTGLRSTLHLVRQIADAVQFAHGRGLIHRDLKPENILIDESGEPRILDFGLVKDIRDGLSSPGLTGTGRFLGSLAYASPEQVEGAPGAVDVRTDVYALGVLLYRLLTGELPHPPGDSLRRTLESIVHEVPCPPRSLRKDLPSDVETIILRCLAKEPERRYPSAGELARDIGSYLEGRPIDAKRDHAAYVLGKLLARHRVATALSLLFVLALVAALTVVSVLYHRTIRAEERVRTSRDAARAQATRADMVRSFLADVLTGADPLRGGSPRRSLGDVLDTASLQMEDRFGALPAVAAEVHTILGSAYYHLGALDRAERHSRQALEILEPLKGEHMADIARQLRRLGLIATDRRELEEAQELLERSRVMFEEVYGREHPEIGQGLLHLAELRQTQFRFQEADDLYRRASEIFESTLEPTDPRRLVASIQWASLLTTTGSLERGETLLERVRSVIEEHPEKTGGLRSGTYLALASARFGDGDLDAAEELADLALESQRRVYGQDHPRLVEICNLRGFVRRARGDFEGAEQWFRRALETSERVVGRESPLTASAQWNLAASEWNQGNRDEALKGFREAVAIRRRVYPAAHPLVVGGLAHVGKLLAESGRWTDSLEVRQELAELQAEARGLEDPRTARAQTFVGECLIALERFEDAERALLKASEVLSAASEVPDAYRDHVWALLAHLYRTWGRPEEAERFEGLRRDD